MPGTDYPTRVRCALRTAQILFALSALMLAVHRRSLEVSVTRRRVRHPLAALVIFRHALLVPILAAPAVACWCGRCARPVTPTAAPAGVAANDQLRAEVADLHRQLPAAQLEAGTLVDGRRGQVRDLKGQLATAAKLPAVPTEAELRSQLRARADQVSALIPPEDAR